MRSETRSYQATELADALAREEPEPMPLPGLVDLRHKGPMLVQTQVLDQAELRQLRADYERIRAQQPIVNEPRASEQTDRTLREAAGLQPPRRFRLIGTLLAILLALVSWSVGRSWLAGQHVARASTKPAPALPAAPVVAAAPAREMPTHAPAANLPRAALEALASGDRELARRIYAELAQHEREPGPYSAAAEILR
jgi:hypothetical protein